MKGQVCKVVTFLAALLAASSAAGQTNRGDTSANIPFAFTVANRTLPPGHYRTTHVTSTLPRIFNSHNQGVVVLTMGVDNKKPEIRAQRFFTATAMTTFSLKCRSRAGRPDARFSSLGPKTR
jgi:hypothetical protein